MFRLSIVNTHWVNFHVKRQSHLRTERDIQVAFSMAVLVGASLLLLLCFCFFFVVVFCCDWNVQFHFIKNGLIKLVVCAFLRSPASSEIELISLQRATRKKVVFSLFLCHFRHCDTDHGFLSFNVAFFRRPLGTLLSHFYLQAMTCTNTMFRSFTGDFFYSNVKSKINAN